MSTDLPQGPTDLSPQPKRRTWLRALQILAAVFFAVVVLIGVTAFLVRRGALRARQAPTAMEAYVASKLVNLSIPQEFKERKNPLSSTAASADVLAGRDLYHTNCESCHGIDGRGPTSEGSGLYPPPLELSSSALASRKRTDGELFYFIRYGVRNTGMPGWQLPDQQTWQLVSYLRNLPITSDLSEAPITNAGAQYVGSAACEKCHEDIYRRWKKTPMANVVRDPREHPEAIIPDLAAGDPLVKFTKDDVALTYGSLWKQRYFKKVGDDYFAEPAQWDVTHKVWKPYFAKDDWWVPFYPLDNFQRPTSVLCDGCHSVNFNVQTHTPTEWNVGCEKCHGPGGEHIKRPIAATIVNPTRQDYVAASDSCIQCHSQGRPPGNPIDGKYYDWPVGYDVTERLSDFWKLEEHKLGETTFTHFADGTAHKNRMQGNDYVQSRMYTHGVTCATCHDAHGTDNPAQLRKPASQLCLDCHGPNSPNGPHAPTIAQHTHHANDSTGSECVACHMPKIEQTIGDVNVRSHTFLFVGPAKTDASKIPNACNACHTDKDTKWTAAALTQWREQSPWRMAQ